MRIEKSVTTVFSVHCDSDKAMETFSITHSPNGFSVDCDLREVRFKDDLVALINNIQSALKQI